MATGNNPLLKNFVEDRCVECFSRRGGNSAVTRHPPLDNVHGVDEGQPIGVFIGLQGGFVHQAADGEMRHPQTEEFRLR